MFYKVLHVSLHCFCKFRCSMLSSLLSLSVADFYLTHLKIHRAETTRLLQPFISVILKPINLSNSLYQNYLISKISCFFWYKCPFVQIHQNDFFWRLLIFPVQTKIFRTHKYLFNPPPLLVMQKNSRMGYRKSIEECHLDILSYNKNI